MSFIQISIIHDNISSQVGDERRFNGWNSSTIHDNICSLLIHKKHHPKSYPSDIKSHMTLNFIVCVVLRTGIATISGHRVWWGNKDGFPVPSLSTLLCYMQCSWLRIQTVAYPTCVSKLFGTLSIKKHYKVNDLELSAKTLQEKGWNHMFDPSFEKLCIESLLVCCVSEPILKVGWIYWDFLFPLVTSKFFRGFKDLK